MVNSNKNERFFEDNMKTDSFLEYPVFWYLQKRRLQRGLFNFDFQNSELDAYNDQTTIIIPTLKRRKQHQNHNKRTAQLGLFKHSCHRRKL